METFSTARMHMDACKDAQPNAYLYHQAPYRFVQGVEKPIVQVPT
jgi:hypothetical protein